MSRDKPYLPTYRMVQMAMFPRSDAALVTALRLRPCGGVVVPVNHSVPFNVLVYPGVVFGLDRGPINKPTDTRIQIDLGPSASYRLVRIRI